MNESVKEIPCRVERTAISSNLKPSLFSLLTIEECRSIPMSFPIESNLITLSKLLYQFLILWYILDGIRLF